VWIGGTEIRVWKEKGVWYVNPKEFKAAIDRHRAVRRRVTKVTHDLHRGVIHGSDGDSVTTEEGGYEVRGNFRFVWSDRERVRHRSYGTWYCNGCNRVAETSHEKQECHRCADWDGCGRDCTLSDVRCEKCGSHLASSRRRQE
jgi:methionyl-tRNA synthetase